MPTPRLTTRRLLMCLAPALAGLVLTGVAHAEIYKFVDGDGNVTYTNIPRPGVRPEVVIGADPPGPARPAARSPARSGTSATPAHFPRIDTGTQRKRDDMRRQLLEQELGSEQRNLTAARQALTQGARQPGADVTRLLDAVRLHERNIEMLRKELSHIR